MSVRVILGRGRLSDVYFRLQIESDSERSHRTAAADIVDSYISVREERDRFAVWKHVFRLLGYNRILRKTVHIAVELGSRGLKMLLTLATYLRMGERMDDELSW